MTSNFLAEMTALMSRVGRANPKLVQDRNVALFIQACIEEAKNPADKKDPGVGASRGSGGSKNNTAM